MKQAAPLRRKNNFMKSVEQYLEVVSADQYIIQVCHALGNSQEHKPMRWTVSYKELMNKLAYLQYLNLKDYNIYARPLNNNFILVDDLTCWKALMSYQPCLVMETSPRNYQAFYRISGKMLTIKDARLYCTSLATTLNGDMRAARPTQVGRLPGFTNRKPKHFKRYGFSPWVKLKHVADQISTFSPEGGQLASPSATQRILATPSKLSHSGDRS